MVAALSCPREQRIFYALKMVLEESYVEILAFKIVMAMIFQHHIDVSTQVTGSFPF